MLDLTIGELLERQASGALSAETITSLYLQRLQQTDGRVGAFLHVDADGAQRAARSVDERHQRGDRLGPLAGIPIAIKDALCVAGQPTTCGSKILQRFVPPYDVWDPLCIFL